MVGRLLLRGMIVGALAGVLAFGFARVFGEPMIDLAIAFEEQTAEPAADPAAPAEPELVSRATQAGAGLFAGVVVYGAAIGGLFALAFAFLYGRLGALGPRGTAALIALAAFVAIALVPALKYPANPPAVGSDDTIGQRTELFFVTLAISIGVMALAVAGARRMWRDLGPWNASLVAGLGYAVMISVAFVALPTIDETPAGFSADVLWNFRVASLGLQAILWGVVGLGFGALAERALAPRLPHPAIARNAAR